MSFHICNVICSIIALFIYISFRFGVDSYLRVNKNSKTYIRKNKKGYLNYWTYKKINEDIGLGNIFHLNVFLLILTPLYSFVSICFGWVNFLSMPIAVCNVILCICQIPAIIFSGTYWNLEYYKKKFVILTKSKSGRGFHSSFYMIFEIIGLLAFAVYNISLAI